MSRRGSRMPGCGPKGLIRRYATRMRALHLIDPHAHGGGGCAMRLAAEAIQQLRGCAHDVLILGGATDAAAARRCGLPTRGHLPVGRALANSQLRQARRRLRDFLAHERRAGIEHDLWHAWGAAMCAIRRPADGRLTLLAYSEGVRAQVTQRYAPEVELDVLEAPVAQSPEFRSRAAVRADWRLRLGVPEDEFTIGLIDDVPALANGWTAAHVAARLRLAGRRVRLVAPPTAWRLAQARSFAGDLGMNDLIVVEEGLERPWKVVCGLDAIVVARRDVGAGRHPVPRTDQVLRLLWPAASVLDRIDTALWLRWAAAAGNDRRSPAGANGIPRPAVVAGRDEILQENTTTTDELAAVNALTIRLSRLYDQRHDRMSIAAAAPAPQGFQAVSRGAQTIVEAYERLGLMVKAGGAVAAQ